MMCPQSCLKLQRPNSSSTSSSSGGGVSEGTAENSHIRYCERTSGGTNVKLQNIQHRE